MTAAKLVVGNFADEGSTPAKGGNARGGIAGHRQLKEVSLNSSGTSTAAAVCCSSWFAKPLLFTLEWRFVSPRDGCATPPIQ
jgi:hypothetical protein